MFPRIALLVLPPSCNGAVYPSAMYPRIPFRALSCLGLPVASSPLSSLPSAAIYHPISQYEIAVVPYGCDLAQVCF